MDCRTEGKIVLKSGLPELSKCISLRLGLFFCQLPLSPNVWTILSLLPAIAGFFVLISDNLAAAVMFFVLAAVMDAIDGGVARVTGRVTNFGAYLDGMTDRFVEAAILFGLMLYGWPDFIIPGWLWLAGMLFFGTTMTTFSRAYADHRKVVTEKEKLEKMGGVLERAERMIVIFISMLVLLIDQQWATWIMAAGVVLAAFTVAQRIWSVYRLRRD